MDSQADKLSLRRLNELPNDTKFRALIWLGAIVISLDKKEPKIEVAFREFDLESNGTSMFGSKSFHFYSRKEGDEEIRGYFPFEIYEIGIGVFMELKIGSIWKEKREVGYVLVSNNQCLNIEVDKINAPEASKNIKELFTDTSSHLVIPDRFKRSAHLIKVEVETEVEKRKIKSIFLFPLSEVVRKFYFHSSLSAEGIISSWLLNEFDLPFQRSNEGIQMVSDKRIAHVDFLHTSLTRNESLLVGLLAYSETAKKGAESIRDSIMVHEGAIARTLFPFDPGEITMDLRVKKVTIANGKWANLVLEILSCNGKLPFDSIQPHSPFLTKASSDPKNNENLNYPPIIRYNNLPEDGDDIPVDTNSVPDKRFQRIQVKIKEDISSGFGGLGVKNLGTVLSTFKSPKKDLFKDGKPTVLASGLWDNSSSEIPGVNIGGDINKDKEEDSEKDDSLNDREGPPIITIVSLDFFIKSVQEIIEKNKTSHEIAEINFMVLEKLKSEYSYTMKFPMPQDSWTVIRKSEQGKNLRRRCVVVQFLFNQRFIYVFEIERAEGEEFRTLLLANTGYEILKDDEIETILAEIVKCKGSNESMKSLPFFSAYRIKGINHKYNLKEQHYSKKLKGIILSKDSPLKRYKEGKVAIEAAGDSTDAHAFS